MSYTLQTTTLLRCNSNAEFQGWGKQISDALANCGMIRLPDANVGTQINWATVTTPNAAFQSRGYEIYRFDDAMQATTPVYFKIEYGSANFVTTPNLWLTVGSGANSSGNVTGNTTTRQQFYSSASSANQASFFAGANNRFIFAINQGGVGDCVLLGMERTLDTTGNVASDGLVVIAFATSPGEYQVVWTPELGNVAPYETSFGVLTPSRAGSPSSFRRQIAIERMALYPLMVNIGAQWYPPQTIVLAYFEGELPRAAPVPFIPVYGANSTYLGLGNVCIDSVAARGSYNTTFAIRWE